MANPNHVYVPENLIWEVDEIKGMDPSSEEFKELLVRLYQNINVHAMAINRNNYDCPTPPPPTPGGGISEWINISSACGTTAIEAGKGYIADSNTLPINLFLPATMEVGSEFAVIRKSGSAGWRIYLNSGQSIYPAGHIVETSTFVTSVGYRVQTQTAFSVSGEDQYISDSGTTMASYRHQGAQFLCTKQNEEFSTRFGYYVPRSKNRVLSPFVRLDAGSVTGNGWKGGAYANEYWLVVGFNYIAFDRWAGLDRWIYSSIGFGQMRDAAYGDSQWVIVAELGVLITSDFPSPGHIWTSRTSTFGATNINAVHYANGIFLSVGDAGKAATSVDGITWTARTTLFGGGESINSITYGNGLWVIAGVSGYIDTSADPTLGAAGWTRRTSGVSNTLRSVVFGESCSFPGGYFVAVGDSADITSSPDGITWTIAADTTAIGANNLSGVWLMQEEWFVCSSTTQPVFQTTDPTGTWDNLAFGPLTAHHGVVSDGRYKVAIFNSGSTAFYIGEIRSTATVNPDS